MNYVSQEELFKILKGAFQVKLRLIRKDKNLTISEMVNDIIDINIDKVDLFLKKQLPNEEFFHTNRVFD